MKIKFLIRDLKVEGVQVVTLRLAQLLVDNGNEVEIVTLYNDNELNFSSDFHVDCFNLNPKMKNKSDKEIYSVFYEWYKKQKDVDYIIASHSETIKLISNVDDARLIPYIHNSDEYSYQNRNIIKKIKYQLKLRRKFKNKHVLCVSDSISDFTEKCLKNKGKNVFTLYNPLDFQAIRELSEHKDETSLHLERYIIFVGRLEKQKRIDRLINAFYLLNDNSLKLLILGEGSLKESLKNQVENLGMDKNVIFHNFIKNPYPLIKKAKLLALTSDHEGLPTVLIESLVIGTPVVSVDCLSGPSEILEGKRSHFLVESFDEKDIAEKLKQVLDMGKIDPSLLECEKFSKEQVYQQFLDVCRKLSS